MTKEIKEEREERREEKKIYKIISCQIINDGENSC